MMLVYAPENPYSLPADTSSADYRHAAKAWLQQYRGMVVKNLGSGDDITITMSGIKHSLVKSLPPKMRTLSVLPDCLAAAEKTGSVPDKLARWDIVMVHKYEVTVIDHSVEHIALIVVRELHDGSKHFYDLSFIAR